MHFTSNAPLTEQRSGTLRIAQHTVTMHVNLRFNVVIVIRSYAPSTLTSFQVLGFAFWHQQVLLQGYRSCLGRRSYFSPVRYCLV